MSSSASSLEPSSSPIVPTHEPQQHDTTAPWRVHTAAPYWSGDRRGRDNSRISAPQKPTYVCLILFLVGYLSIVGLLLGLYCTHGVYEVFPSAPEDKSVKATIVASAGVMLCFCVLVPVVIVVTAIVFGFLCFVANFVLIPLHAVAVAPVGRCWKSDRGKKDIEMGE
jgi:hypothetical protein